MFLNFGAESLCCAAQKFGAKIQIQCVTEPAELERALYISINKIHLTMEQPVVGKKSRELLEQEKLFNFAAGYVDGNYTPPVLLLLLQTFSFQQWQKNKSN